MLPGADATVVPAMGLPAIRDKSPLAQGLTVNLCQASDKTRLRVWAQGAAVEDSVHDTPKEAVSRLAAIVVERVGGQNIAATLLRML